MTLSRDEVRKRVEGVPGLEVVEILANEEDRVKAQLSFRHHQFWSYLMYVLITLQSEEMSKGKSESRYNMKLNIQGIHNSTIVHLSHLNILNNPPNLIPNQILPLDFPIQ